MHEQGQWGIPQDFPEAVKWLRQAAEQGKADAQSKLAWMYKNGLGVLQSYSEAVNWYRLAAEQDNAYAQASLGDMYANGKGVLSGTMPRL